MLTIIFGVNIIAFANYEDVTINNDAKIILDNKVRNIEDKEFDNQGIVNANYVGASKVRAEKRKDLTITSVLIITLGILTYFLGKVMVYFKSLKKYKKAIMAGEKIDKPKIEIKLKYIILLLVAIDILIWVSVILVNL